MAQCAQCRKRACMRKRQFRIIERERPLRKLFCTIVCAEVYLETHLPEWLMVGEHFHAAHNNEIEIHDVCIERKARFAAHSQSHRNEEVR